MLDLGSVTRRVGKKTVLFHSDLQGDTGCEHGTRAIPSSWNGVWDSPALEVAQCSPGLSPLCRDGIRSAPIIPDN